MYNIMKRSYRSSNVYTFGQLITLLNDSDCSTATPVSDNNDFRNWDAKFDKLYKRFPSGAVHQSHIFVVSWNHPTTMNIQVSRQTFDAKNVIEKDRIKVTTNREMLLLSKPDVIPPLGIPP